MSGLHNVYRLPLHLVFWRDLLAGQLLFAFGLSLLFVAAAMVAATAGIPDEQQGLASGLLNTTEQVGGAIGLAVLLAAALARTASLPGGKGKALSDALPSPQAQVSGFSFALLVAAGFAVVAIVLTLVLIGEHKDEPQPQPEASDIPEPAPVCP